MVVILAVIFTKEVSFCNHFVMHFIWRGSLSPQENTRFLVRLAHLYRCRTSIGIERRERPTNSQGPPNYGVEIKLSLRTFDVAVAWGRSTGTLPSLPYPLFLASRAQLPRRWRTGLGLRPRHSRHPNTQTPAPTHPWWTLAQSYQSIESLIKVAFMLQSFSFTPLVDNGN